MFDEAETATNYNNWRQTTAGGRAVGGRRAVKRGGGRVEGRAETHARHVACTCARAGARQRGGPVCLGERVHGRRQRRMRVDVLCAKRQIESK